MQKCSCLVVYHHVKVVVEVVVQLELVPGVHLQQQEQVKSEENLRA